MTTTFTLAATATFGLEAVVGHEIRALGYEPKVSQGRVTFEGDAAAICRSNLWLRSADRVQWVLGEFYANTFDELFDAVAAMPWADWLPRNATFPVTGKSVKSKLHSVPACQSIVKKAVVKALGKAYNLQQLPEDGPSYPIQFHLLNDKCQMVLDTSGYGLHKRGYRTQAGAAPMKETLAAGIIQLSRWHPDRMLVDPCCGTGTIPIEAALLALNMAPGRHRRFAASDWALVGDKAWREAIDEADSLARPDREVRIYGSDLDGEVLKLARQALDTAGLTGKVFFEKKAMADFRSKIKYGFMISNPPYGERIGERKETEALYRAMGEKAKELEGWGWYILTAHQDFETFFGRPADKRRKLYNGNIRCDLYQYKAAPLPRRERTDAEGRPLVTEADEAVTADED
jgi:putative N6-adenine-specific DNA methylase